MDTQTRHALKQDKFVTATTSGLDWIGEHRGGVVLWAAGVVLVIALMVTGILMYQKREAAANQLLGQAMDIYETPLLRPGQPVEPGMKTYASAADRAKAAYPVFSEAADKYSWLRAGEMARYFAGMTAIDLGKKSTAAADLQKASHSDSNLAALAKVALASLDAQSDRREQAVSLLQGLIAHPTTTVPKAQAQLQLAAIYETSDPNKARQLYAEIKDQNKDTDAGQIATQKLAALK